MIPGVLIYRFDAALLFFNADHFKSRIRTLIAEAGPQLNAFILDAENMAHMDTTGAANLEEVIQEVNDKGITFAIAEAKSPLRIMLERVELTQKIGESNLFQSVAAAVATADQSVRDKSAEPN